MINLGTKARFDWCLKPILEVGASLYSSLGPQGLALYWPIADQFINDC